MHVIVSTDCIIQAFMLFSCDQFVYIMCVGVWLLVYPGGFQGTSTPLLVGCSSHRYVCSGAVNSQRWTTGVEVEVVTQKQHEVDVRTYIFNRAIVNAGTYTSLLPVPCALLVQLSRYNIIRICWAVVLHSLLTVEVAPHEPKYLSAFCAHPRSYC